MSDSFTLINKKVLITRELEDSRPFAEKIVTNGGIPVTVPLVGFQAVALNEENKCKITSLHEYDWIVFTSKKGVEYFFEQVGDVHLPCIAVIGDKTKQVLEKLGFQPHFVPTEFVAECFVEEFVPLLKANSKVLLVKGNLARTLIAEQIQKAKSICDEVIIYENRMPIESKEKLREVLTYEGIDIITFASSSSVHHFMKVIETYRLHDYISSSTIACIGPVAKKTAEQYGLYVDVCANKYTMDGLFESLLHYFKR